MTQRTVHVRITGRVQGVGYRAWTERVAAELRLRGWVRNRRDGSVEAVFSGNPAAVSAMLERCKTGSRDALVEGIVISERSEGDDIPEGFQFRPTTE